ncbi:hypothetical protein N9850_04080 [Granulosicoccus sp.]|nr:hypothetical protein [Granulosicoccus sp.]MDB4222927.1 hypothetical protein [Granulosicoccus sp.]
MFIKEAKSFDTFLKIYVPLLLGIIYFAGFNYVNEFYRFFGLVGIYREFTLAEFAINAYFVVKELLLFSYPVASVIFFTFIIIAAVMISIPNYRFSFPASSGYMQSTLHGRSVFPALARFLLLLLFAFYVMNECSRLVGSGHGCVKLSKSTSVINLVGYGDLKSANNSLSEDLRELFTKELAALISSDKMIEVWANDEFIFLSQKTKNCDGRITTFKVPHSMYLYSVTSYENS